MTPNTLTARAFPLALVALTATAACSGSESEGPGGNAGGSSGASSAGSGGAAGGSSGGAAGGTSQAGAGGKGGSSGKGGASSGGAVGSGGDAAGNGGTADSAGAAGSGGTAGSGGGESCADRTGGALIEFGVVKETISVWIENEAFITEAQRLLAAGETRVPVFNTLVDGSDCDPKYSWHPDPNDVEFADFTIEVCDAVPSYIEENKQEWFDTVAQWCPWSAVVVSVTER